MKRRGALCPARLCRRAAVPALFLVALSGCRPTPAAAPGTAAATTVISPAAAAAAPVLTPHSVRFTDVTAAAGVRWSYQNGAVGRHLFIETTGGGVALLDFNHDGWLDLFAVQGGPVPGASPAESRFSRSSALYRNNGDGTFTDVTPGSGLEGPLGYGQGVAAADYDNDGWTDLYVTAYGGNHLFRNNGDATFTDVTRRAGVADRGPELPWPLSAAWGDYDADGRLDLFVCHYARWSPALNRPCRSPNGQLSYCRPQVYEGSASRLYHNNGDGTFADVTERAGIARLTGKSMAAAWIDLRGEGHPDLFVTNDTVPNFLLRNDGHGKFTDVALVSGVAVGATGGAMSGMGIGVGDYDNDGRLDLIDTNFAGEPKGVWRNTGAGRFQDRSYPSNLASTNLQFLGFGLELFDYDLDGYRDLVVGNGHVLDDPSSLGSGTTYAQSRQLFRNQGDGTFREDLRSLGDLVQPRVVRGLAVGDLDNDGDADVVTVAQNGPLELFRNDGGNGSHWISFRLEGTVSSRDAVGARLRLRAGARKLTGWVRGGSSYCSTSDPRLLFGLAGESQVEDVEVRWPRGKVQHFGKLPCNRFYLLREGDAPQPEPRRGTAGLR